MTFDVAPDAILFDFDGVLAASHALHAGAWHEAAREQGFDAPLSEMLRRYSGLAPRSIAAGLASELGGDAPRLYARKLELMTRNASQVPLLSGARELLSWCQEHAIPHGIASNSPASLVRDILQAYQLLTTDMILLGEEEEHPPKPDPGPYLRLFSMLGLERERHTAWIVEDSLPGIRAAVASQLGQTLAIARHDLSRQEVLDEGACHVFESPRDILDLLLSLRENQGS